MRWLYHLRAEDGTLLYVGCTEYMWRRLREHARKPWWSEVGIVEWEPMEWREAWFAEQEEIRTAPGRYNVTQLENARRGWETRHRRQKAAHEGGYRCQVANCATCRSVGEIISGGGADAASGDSGRTPDVQPAPSPASVTCPTCGGACATCGGTGWVSAVAS
jgi:hypothetical protein